ncbi:hypothetical protein B0H13DRAFT_1907556 [Mycena leptocephala]|nr:hypothetical protein B0H13DRAFT_1907556 [Mycena leptocephala]
MPSGRAASRTTSKSIAMFAVQDLISNHDIDIMLVDLVEGEEEYRNPLRHLSYEDSDEDDDEGDGQPEEGEGEQQEEGDDEDEQKDDDVADSDDDGEPVIVPSKRKRGRRKSLLAPLKSQISSGRQPTQPAAHGTQEGASHTRAPTLALRQTETEPRTDLSPSPRSAQTAQAIETQITRAEYQRRTGFDTPPNTRVTLRVSPTNLSQRHGSHRKSGGEKHRWRCTWEETTTDVQYQ